MIYLSRGGNFNIYGDGVVIKSIAIDTHSAALVQENINVDISVYSTLKIVLSAWNNLSANSSAPCYLTELVIK